MEQGWIALKSGDIAYVRQQSHRDDWVRRLDGGGAGTHDPDIHWPRGADGWLKMAASREEAQAMQDTAIAQRKVELFRLKARRELNEAEAAAAEALVRMKRARAAAEKAEEDHVAAVRVLAQAQRMLARVQAVQDSENTWPIKLVLLEDAE